MPSPPLLLHVFPSFAVGGTQARLATILNHFGRRWRHAIVAMDNNLAARERLDPSLDVTFPALALPKRSIAAIRLIRAALQDLRPDTLVTSNWGTIEWAIANRRLPNRPIIHQVHVEDGFGPEERARQIPRRVLVRRLMLAGRHVVVPSTTLRRIALDTWRLAPARVHYVPNGVDLVRFGPGHATTWPALGIPALGDGEGPIVGTVAALRPEKNIARLLHAFAIATNARPGHPPARLVVIGDGPDRPMLEALAASLGIAGRTLWAGHTADPAPLLRGLDIFALSSDTEQMPISLLEAMAAALPVAATDVGDIAAILPAPQRRYVTPIDAAPLATALAALIDDAILRRALGTANRARVEADFALPRMLDRWAALFDGKPIPELPPP